MCGSPERVRAKGLCLTSLTRHSQVDVNVRVESSRLFETHSKVLAGSSAFFERLVTVCAAAPAPSSRPAGTPKGA